MHFENRSVRDRTHAGVEGPGRPVSPSPDDETTGHNRWFLGFSTDSTCSKDAIRSGRRPYHPEGVGMNKERGLLSSQREISLPKWLGVSYRCHVRTVLSTLFRISCWSAVAWLVWNRVLSSYFNAGSVGPLLSFGLGSFLYAMSIILQD